MQNTEDIKLLETFRGLIDKYLFRGKSPSKYSPDLSENDKALEKPEYAQLRRDINEQKSEAHEILEYYGIGNVVRCYPPPIIGGPIIEVNIFDLVTSNVSFEDIEKHFFLDKIDEAIGAIRKSKRKVRHVKEGAIPSIKKEKNIWKYTSPVWLFFFILKQFWKYKVYSIVLIILTYLAIDFNNVKLNIQKLIDFLSSLPIL